jgi:hypothetical protein
MEEDVMDQIAKVEEQATGHFVIARSSTEMKHAQARLVEWFTGKVNEEKVALRDIQQAIESAEMNRLTVRGLVSAERRQRQRVVFYDKCRAAVEAGYQIIPDMGMDIFAIRTDRKNPSHQHATSTYNYPSLRDEEARALPPGEGRYVSPQQLVRRGDFKVKDQAGKEITKWFTQTVDHGDVEFPVIAAAPALMSAASEALALKLFDEIGVVVPQAQHPDPILIGRIRSRGGRAPASSERRMAFLIAWWIDLRSL